MINAITHYCTHSYTNKKWTEIVTSNSDFRSFCACAYECVKQCAYM